LESAELRAKNRMDITMRYWHENVNKILEFQDKNVLQNAGSISNKQMEDKIREIYTEFDKRRKKYEALQADKADLEELKILEEKVKKNKKEDL
jgi:hypothetical protein